jgi:hypothetical protein
MVVAAGGAMPIVRRDRWLRAPLLLLLATAALAACVDKSPEPAVGPTPQPDGGPPPNPEPTPGQTDFTTVEQGGSFGAGGSSGAADGGAASPGSSSAAGSGGSSGATNDPGAPGGRVAEVEEADTYRLAGTRLYYLNTYRGFLIYDVADPKQPVAVSRLPVYGYPIEMFVEGNLVYALLRDALYLTTVDGKLQFQRHNVSQLVTIDVSDPAAPRVIKTMDIIGQLREGVSRKVEKTIYVVSQQLGGYSWGWPSVDVNPTEQAWVYSYDISDAANPRLAGQLQIFEGGNRLDPGAGGAGTGYRYFSGVAISATANALLVTENWYGYQDTGGACGFQNRQQAVVSLIDISDPKGAIRRHTRFETLGQLNDQFKMTYRSDPVTGKGTFFGIFARQDWGGCGGSQTQNILESWDVSDGARPQRLAQLQFGKPNETVRASSYDLARNVVYAITARQIDPLYAIDISNPAAPRVLSEIDGLSGSVSVFRQVAGGQFLLGVGDDQSDSCAGIQDGNLQSTRMALTIIDVRNLNQIRLVQRKCITVKNAGWSWSGINGNFDQAHKMLGMFQDGDLNVLTVPVTYAVREEGQGGQSFGWWYHSQTAVGLLSWDLTRYDPALSPAQQTVVQGYGTFLHPEGAVSRSILFRHPVSGERSMINVSDTHLSVANIQDLDNPRLESIVEVAPSVSELHAFGGHVVERVDLGGGRWSPQGMSEFRVKVGGGGLAAKQPVATFRVGQAAAVYRLKDNLVVLRNEGNTQEVLTFGLADPTQPRLLSRVTAPLPYQSGYGYYGYYCGMGSWGYWFGQGAQTIMTDGGLAWLRREWSGQPGAAPELKLVFLDLSDPAKPALHEKAVTLDEWGQGSLVADPGGAGFYLVHRKRGQVTQDPSGNFFTSYRYYAQRWDLGAAGHAAGADINLPGTLARTWLDGSGARMFLTHDNAYRMVPQDSTVIWHSDTRLNLLRQLGTDKAELLDARTFADQYLRSMVQGEGKLYLGAQRTYWGRPALSGNKPGWEETSDRLVILDVGAAKLTVLYDQPLRTYGAQLMGASGGNLFINVAGDGVLVTDVTDPMHPRGRRFMRTLGWGSQIELTGTHAYVPSGNFGVFELDLTTLTDFLTN